ncbi:MAG: cobyrinate a,c-diamide synthase [Lachnospiraceae bacterium]|nr:cobyrinate a,c-diamide synthase [Lachnospiraceae bacterium]
MKMKRVMIAAPKSGSGKTVVTCALLQVLKDHGWKVASYKCGPDYIDPMFHEKIIDVPSKNLDTFFTEEERTRELFLNSAKNRDFAVFEGVMGLYDGLGGVRKEGSSYHLAEVTKTPIVLVVEAKGMGRSVIPLIAGFLAYDKKHLIKGIILNRISKGYYETVKTLIEEELKTKVIGFLPEKEELHFESRHLGLFLPEEVNHIKERLQAASELISNTVSIECIKEVAENAEELEVDETIVKVTVTEEYGEADHEKATGGLMEGVVAQDGRPTIAVAKDEAFCFYYADNIRLLEEYGARITYFSPLHDEKLPEKCHALLIGGGYPELYAKQLSANRKMCEAVKNAVDNEMPIVAECGGFMYLHSSLKDKEGLCYDMAGVIPATCFYTGKLVRFGYIELRETQKNFWLNGEGIKGHEFHYYDSTYNGADVIAAKPVTGKEYACIIENKRQWMGFPHLYYPSNPVFARAFIEKAKKYQEDSYRSRNYC